MGTLLGPGRDPLEFFAQLTHRYGDVVHFRMGAEHVVLLNDPALIRDVLVTHNRNFRKGRALERARKLLGDGLLTSEGATHLQRRRMIQPAFHRDRISAYAEVMVENATRMRERWADGVTLDVADEMMRLTLAIVGRTLFDTDIESGAPEFGEALTEVLDSFWMLLLPFGDVLERLPIRPLQQGRAARERLDAMIYGMITQRRARGGERGDLLSMLLQSRDDEGGALLTDAQVRDEAMTIVLAGHETTANALTWTWYLLSQAPEVERQLHEELDRVLGNRPPTMADVGALTFTEKVVTESMRLYPPAWMVGRRALEPYAIGSHTVPARTIVIMSQYVMHRDVRFYEAPMEFRPDRWMPEMKAALPRFAYFPFGGGPRQCVGESFAWMELALLLATIAQRWRLDLEPGHPVVPRPVVTLRPKHGMRMVVRARAAQ
jgi:cytochrome P450